MVKISVNEDSENVTCPERVTDLCQTKRRVTNQRTEKAVISTDGPAELRVANGRSKRDQDGSGAGGCTGRWKQVYK